MESPWNTSKMKVLKSRTSNENVPPLQIDIDDRRGRYLQLSTMSPRRFQPYAAENSDVSSPLARYLFSGSPLSGKITPAGDSLTPPTFGASKYRTTKAHHYNSSGSSSFGSRGRFSPSPLSSIENFDLAALMSPPMYRTPATGDDDVIVMDDILVRPMSGGKSARSSSSSSGRGSSSSSLSSTAQSVLKAEICRVLEESGNCRYNSKCQGVKEDQTGDTTEPGVQTSSGSTRAGSNTHGPSNRTVHQQHAAAETDYEGTTSQPTSSEPNQALNDSDTPNEWSPMDDGIEVVLPNGSGEAPSKEEVEAHISSVIFGPIPKRRLPVFVALCGGKHRRRHR